MTSKAKTTLFSGVAAAAMALMHAVPAHAQHRIVGDFSEPSALRTVLDQARLTFAYWTTWGSGAQGVTDCPNPGDYTNCWVYWQPEPTSNQVFGGLRVEPVYDSHYHLGFDDQSIYDNVCFVDPGDGGGSGFGRLVGSTCVAPDWTLEHREGPAAHDNGEWFWFTVEAWDNSVGSDGYRLFDLESFTLTSTDPVDFWILADDGNWYVLQNLGQGYHNVADFAYWISDAEVGSDSGYTSIDDVIVSDIHF